MMKNMTVKLVATYTRRGKLSISRGYLDTLLCQENLGISLNHKKSIEEHPLVDLAYIENDENHTLPLLDIVYRKE